MLEKLNNSQSGDTIVEVLIAIAIVGIVLVGAFVSANRSLLGTQVSKERVEALQYVRGQMEILMQRLEQDTPTPIVPPDGSNNQCYDIDDPDLALTSGCGMGVNDKYNVTITRGSHQYTISATWEKARGGSGDPETIALNYNASR